jgi:hypothetical protein
MQLGVAFPAVAQPAELVQPGEGALDHPAERAEPGAARGAAAGDDRLDAARGQRAPVRVEVIAAVGDDAVGAQPRPADLARTGPAPSTSGSNCVTSSRLPPVSVTASGMPELSVNRWCLEPGRPRSTGDGPVKA